MKKFQHYSVNAGNWLLKNDLTSIKLSQSAIAKLPNVRLLINRVVLAKVQSLALPTA